MVLKITKKVSYMLNAVLVTAGNNCCMRCRFLYDYDIIFCIITSYS